MQAYYVKYKPFLLFLGKFLLTYVLLTFVYQLYLNSFDKASFETDGFTRSVAHQTEQLIAVFNEEVSTLPHSGQASIKLYYNHKFVSRIVEGCNAISVIILFISFIVAFTGRLKTTLLFIVAGTVVIHILNVIRIALLSAALYHFPDQEEILHNVVFPLFIYGVVFILWVIWVNQFSWYAAIDRKKQV